MHIVPPSGAEGRVNKPYHNSDRMNFDVPAELTSYLETLGSFIECTILPLQRTDDNNRFFDHRQEYARTDWTQGGIPPKEWEGLIGMIHHHG